MTEALATQTQTLVPPAPTAPPSALSRYLRPTMSYIGLTQNMTTWSPASGTPRPVPGKIRIASTGLEYDEMQLVILSIADFAEYHVPGTKIPTRDTVLCFSRNLVMNEQDRIIGGTPDGRAKQPQAMYCKGCVNSSWAQWNVTRAKEDVPACKPFAHLVVVDRITKILYYMDVKGTSMSKMLKNGLRQSMNKIANLIQSDKASGKQAAELYDYTFKVYAEPQDNGRYYTLALKDIQRIATEDRAEFGLIYQEFLSRQGTPELTPPPSVVAQEVKKVEAQLVGESTQAVDGDYVQI